MYELLHRISCPSEQPILRDNKTEYAAKMCLVIAAIEHRIAVLIIHRSIPYKRLFIAGRQNLTVACAIS